MNTYPTWTGRDLYDTGVYTLHRERLWLCNYGASMWPQIYSWMVVNIYPASSRHDYRFDDNFLDRAILVTVDWHTNGKGCENISCYPTFPTQRNCTETEGPVVFPSGDLTTVVACQPACFVTRRTKQLIKSMNRDQNMYTVDDSGVVADDCPTCKYIAEPAAYRTNRWLYGSVNEIEEYDARDESSLKRKRRIDDFPRVRFDETNTLKRNADMLSFKWDPKYNNCILMDEVLYRNVVEPIYRNPTPKCKYTNFELGEDVIWGLRFREANPRFEPNYNFAVGHSSAYCRAFNKKRDPETRDCYTPWWIKALSYTILGDGLMHGIHSLVHYENDCIDPWRVSPSDRDQVKITFDSTTNYYKWQRDVNVKFVLPPPNVTLTDLGIDVKVTGNRLYWNNVEGIVSQFVMFRTVEELTASSSDVALLSSSLSSSSSLLSSSLSSALSSSDPFATRLLSATDKFVPNADPYYAYSRSSLYRTYDYSNNCNYNDENDDHRSDDHLPHDSKYNRTMLLMCRDLMREKVKRLRERKISRSSMDLRDSELDERVREIWPRVKESLRRDAEQQAKLPTVWKSRSRRLPIGKSSVPYSLHQYEFLSQKMLSSRIENDPSSVLLPNVPDSTVSPLKTIEEIREQRRQGQSGENSELDKLLEEMMNVLSKNELLESMRDMGISLSYDFVIEPLIIYTLKRLFDQTLRMISLYTERVVSTALLRVGLRLAAVRSIAATVTALSVRSMMIASEAASVVGIVLAITGLVSLVFDIALMSGWDPGNFKNETDLSVYYDMAKYFAETMNIERRGEISPLDMLRTMYEVVSTDQQDFDTVKETFVMQKQRRKKRTSDANNENNTAYDNDDDNNDDNGDKDDDAPSVIPLPDDNDNDDEDDDVPSVVPLPGEDDGKASAKPRFNDIREERLHVNERLSQPKWFNKQFTACFAKNYKTHSLIANSLSFWNVVQTFDFLGSLQTNSFGQRLVSYPRVVQLNEQDITSLITETSYRRLLTTTSKANMDNRAYNRRVDASKRGNRLFAFVGLGIGAIGLIATVVPKVWQTDVQFRLSFPLLGSLLVVVALLSFVFAILVLVPVKASPESTDDTGNNGGDDGSNSDNNEDDSNDNGDGDNDNDDGDKLEDILKNDINEYWRLSRYIEQLRRMIG